MDQKPLLIDSHCHFDFPEFDGRRERLLLQCAELGIGGIIVPAVARNNWSRIHQLAAAHQQIWPAYGLHPYFTEQHTLDHMTELDEWLGQSDAVAVGEVGLDLYDGDATLPRQLELFKGQIAVAKNHALPLIIHARKSYDLILKYLRQAKFSHGGVVHAFAGSYQQAEKLLELGFKLGFGGAVTYDRATKLRATLAKLPLETILLETDAPDMPPSFAPGEPNSPTNLFQIAQQVAQLKEVTLDRLAAASSENAQMLFDIDVKAK